MNPLLFLPFMLNIMVVKFQYLLPTVYTVQCFWQQYCSLLYYFCFQDQKNDKSSGRTPTTKRENTCINVPLSSLLTEHLSSKLHYALRITLCHHKHFDRNGLRASFSLTKCSCFVIFCYNWWKDIVNCWWRLEDWLWYCVKY